MLLTVSLAITIKDVLFQMFLVLISLIFGCLDNNAGHLAFLVAFSVATLESPIRLDLSDDDDDDSSGYFADAETSSCGSCDDDIGWSEISGNKGRAVCPVKARPSHLPPLYLCSPYPKYARPLILTLAFPKGRCFLLLSENWNSQVYLSLPSCSSLYEL